jgi:hypothetical protein
MKKIMEICHLENYKELSKKIGLSESAIKKDMPYGLADKSIQKKVSLGTLSQRQVREIVQIKDKEEQKKVAKLQVMSETEHNLIHNRFTREVFK